MERLQQFHFEVLHRKGRAHRNADRLSRRRCEVSSCNYCAKIEKKNEEQEKFIARISFVGEDLEAWRKDQKEDSSISLIHLSKTAGIRPSRSEVASWDDSARIYWLYWDVLVLKDNILYKKMGIS